MKTYLRVTILVFLTLLITSCTKGPTPEDAVISAIEAFSQRDASTVSKYFTYNELFGKIRSEIEREDEIGKLLLADLDCEIISVEKNRKDAVVKAEISNLDLDSIYSEYVEESMNVSLAAAFSDRIMPSEERMVAYFVDLLKREDNPIYSSVVEIKMEKSGDSWFLEMDEALEKAISGGKDYTFIDVSLAFRD